MVTPPYSSYPGDRPRDPLWSSPNPDKAPLVWQASGDARVIRSVFHITPRFTPSHLIRFLVLTGLLLWLREWSALSGEIPVWHIQPDPPPHTFHLFFLWLELKHQPGSRSSPRADTCHTPLHTTPQISPQMFLSFLYLYFNLSWHVEFKLKWWCWWWWWWWWRLR